MKGYSIQIKTKDGLAYKSKGGYTFDMFDATCYTQKSVAEYHKNNFRNKVFNDHYAIFDNTLKVVESERIDGQTRVKRDYVCCADSITGNSFDPKGKVVE